MRIFLAFLLFSVSAFGTILYTDDVTPADDLPSSGFPLLGTLGPGMWTVNGSLATQQDYDLNETNPDEDTFSVQAALGDEIISERIQFTLRGTGTSITEPIDGTTPISASIDHTLTPVAPFTGAMDIDIIGSPELVCTGPSGTPPCTDNTTTYSITFTVDTITPEPSSATLSVSGLGLFAAALALKRRIL